MVPLGGDSCLIADVVFHRFSNYPGSSPSSYRADDSFLQRAALQGSISLTAASAAERDEQERGRQSTKSRRAPSSSTFSTGGTRLSPTQELESPSASDTEDEEEYHGPPRMPPSAPFRDLDVVTEATPLLPAQSSLIPASEDAPAPTAIRQELGILLGYMLP